MLALGSEKSKRQRARKREQERDKIRISVLSTTEECPFDWDLKVP